MDTAVRPWLTTGVAFVGASAIALAPIAPSWSPEHTHVAPPAVSTQFTPTALDIPYILTFPIVRQNIDNWATDLAVNVSGLLRAGVGAGQTVVAIPADVVQVIRDVLALDLTGALDTVTGAVRDGVVAIGAPLLNASIWVAQRNDLVNAALASAQPAATIAVVNGVLNAANHVATAFIGGTQDLVAAIVSLNLSNIVNAAVDGTVGFVQSLGVGVGDIVSGIEDAQHGISEALAARPATPPFGSTFSGRSIQTPSATDTMLKTRSPLKALTLSVDDTVAKNVSAPTTDTGTGTGTEVSSPALPKTHVNPFKAGVTRTQAAVDRLANRLSNRTKNSTVGAKDTTATGTERSTDNAGTTGATASKKRPSVRHQTGSNTHRGPRHASHHRSGH